VNPAPYNPRKDLKPGDAEYEKLKRSIDHWDLVEPLVWNERTGNLVGGHQRLKILKARGDTEVDVSVVNLSEIDEKALNIALNKIHGEWDKRLLADLLQDIDTGDVDLTSTGMDDDEITTLLAADYGPVDIEAYLDELDMSSAIGKPVWAVIRASSESIEIIERVLAVLEQNNIRVERSYDTGA
jgi:ParB-like chromosome segregation protein Spo0J